MRGGVIFIHPKKETALQRSHMQGVAHHAASPRPAQAVGGWAEPGLVVRHRTPPCMHAQGHQVVRATETGSHVGLERLPNPLTKQRRTPGGCTPFRPPAGKDPAVATHVPPTLTGPLALWDPAAHTLSPPHRSRSHRKGQSARSDAMWQGAAAAGRALGGREGARRGGLVTGHPGPLGPRCGQTPAVPPPSRGVAWQAV